MKLLEAIQHLWLGANNYNSTVFFVLFLFFAATDVRGLDTDKLHKIFPSSILAYKNLIDFFILSWDDGHFPLTFLLK